MRTLAQSSDLQWVKFWLAFNILDLVATYKVVGGAVTEGNWLLAQLMSIDFGLMCCVKLLLAALIGWVLIRTAKGRLLKPLSIGLGLVVLWNVGIGALFS